MKDHGLEQMVHYPTPEKNTLDLILTTLPGQFHDFHSPDKLCDHDIVSGNLKIFIPPIKKPRRKVYRYQKSDYESMRKDTLEFAKEKYFNGVCIRSGWSLCHPFSSSSPFPNWWLDMTMVNWAVILQYNSLEHNLSGGVSYSLRLRHSNSCSGPKRQRLWCVFKMIGKIKLNYFKNVHKWSQMG